jgi:hypothetical protein
LWKWLVHASATAVAPSASLAPLLAWRLQHRAPAEVARVLTVDGGRRGLEKRLRELLRVTLPGRPDTG